MSFASIVTRTWEEERLFSVLLELTYRCNLDCVFCYNDVGKRGRPLSREDYGRLLDDLAGMQVMNLTFSGGEPLAHPDLFPLGRRARELGFVVRLKTNGHAVDAEMASRLKREVDPFLLEVSLHGARPGTHDRQTRVAGSFDRLVANLAAMRAEGLRVRISCTLTRWNEDEVEGMLDLAESFGMAVQFNPVVSARDDGDRSPLELAPTPGGVAGLLAVQKARSEARRRAAGETGENAAAGPAGFRVAREGDDVAGAAPPSKHCGAGSATVTVDPYGDVFPCVQWRVPVGNLREAGIREIWETSSGLRAVRQANAEVKSRLAAFGPDVPLLAHCPGSAASASGGDPAWLSPEQLRNYALRRASRA